MAMNKSSVRCRLEVLDVNVSPDEVFARFKQGWYTASALNTERPNRTNNLAVITGDDIDGKKRQVYLCQNYNSSDTILSQKS